MAPCLKLLLFGSPHIERDGQALELKSRKEMALLAYLAITGPKRKTLSRALSRRICGGGPLDPVAWPCLGLTP
jgi:hypothetical protein